MQTWNVKKQILFLVQNPDGREVCESGVQTQQARHEPHPVIFLSLCRCANCHVSDSPGGQEVLWTPEGAVSKINEDTVFY